MVPHTCRLELQQVTLSAFSLCQGLALKLVRKTQKMYNVLFLLWLVTHKKGQSLNTALALKLARALLLLPTIPASNRTHAA
jgi:hypothetical protein